MWRCDWLPSPTAVEPKTTWHDTKAGADIAEWRLRFNGIKRTVVWFDAAVYEGVSA